MNDDDETKCVVLGFLCVYFLKWHVDYKKMEFISHFIVIFKGTSRIQVLKAKQYVSVFVGDCFRCFCNVFYVPTNRCYYFLKIVFTRLLESFNNYDNLSRDQAIKRLKDVTNEN